MLYRLSQLDYKETWVLKNWCFQTVVLEKTLESPLDCKRSNQSILKEINPEYSLEGLMLKLKLQHYGHQIRRTDSLEKTLDAGKNWRQEKGMTEDKIVGWHHWLNGHEFQQSPGDDIGQGRLACCRPLDCKKLDKSESLNNQKIKCTVLLNINSIESFYSHRSLLWNCTKCIYLEPISHCSST